MKFAYPEYREVDLKPYEIRENGVYATEAFRDVCQPGTIFNWTPADDMGWPGSPNPDTAPFLPIPFDAKQLAAAMIDGAGQSIAYAMEHRLGYPLNDGALNKLPDRMRWMRDALTEAYAVAAAAQSVVGEFDHDQQARAHAMAQQFEEANEQANDREGVFEQGIPPNEASARRARAVASVADLKAQTELEQAAVAKKWKAWRKAMVRQLLRADMRGDLSDIKTESDRQAESFGFYSVFLDLEHWAALTDVAAREAAMLLSLHNPRKESFEEAKTTRRPDMSEWHLEHLDRMLANYAAQNPRPCRSLRAWYSAAREMKIKLDPEAVSFMEHVARHMESDSTPAAAPVSDSASNAPVVPFKKSALVAAHVHEWPTIERDISDATANGLATAAKAGTRGWREADALTWARAKGKLISAAKPADSLTQAMYNLGKLPSQKHTMQG
jgi:hypothetical protein